MKNKTTAFFAALCLSTTMAYAQQNTLSDVWDFGAAQLDATQYNNHLTEDIINGWYDASIAPGTEGPVLPSHWEAGRLSWTGGSNDRLRTSNTYLTRYDTKKDITIEGQTLTGYIYVNASAKTDRYLSLQLEQDDEIQLYCSTQNSTGIINFVYAADPALQTDVTENPVPSTGVLLTFTAKQAGEYRIYDTKDKPSYYRVIRKPAVYVTIQGSIQTEAGVTLPDGYGLSFTNESGKAWTATPANGQYSVSLPAGHTYKLALANANGFVIDQGATLETGNADATHDIHVSQVTLCTLDGAISGLGEHVSNLRLQFVPATERVFVPEPAIDADASTYSVQLEPDVEYAIVAEGVNDYSLTNNTVTVQGDNTQDLVFEAKPVYAVTIQGEGLSDEQNALLQLTFTNLNEEGYAYSFASPEGITLRDGVYSVVASGLDAYPLQQALTSNLKVEGQAVSKTIPFEPVSVWEFDDKAITAADTYYKGIALAGGIKNEQAKGHITGGNGATMVVPVATGSKMTVSYYYSANFTINGGEAVTTNSGSTSRVEQVEYVNETQENTVTIAFGGTETSYITAIRVDEVVPYSEEITVGDGQQYATINEALDAVRSMDRTEGQRVRILIEPGNYEEMLVVDVPDVSLVNASATPSIALTDKGVNIDANAVRITSYYGHGYSYYSMANNQKWDAETLAVNKENGYLSYENTGGSATNNSYWNATVVVTADGFEAENIIFENSFNQYISKKESEDVVVEWEVGGKGARPTEAGSTEVQNKSFVERAAAIALVGSDKVILNNCRVVGRQDSFYGGDGVRAAIYKGVMMGGTDYLFGEMTAVFYHTQLAMNTSEDKNDVSYITAAKQSSGRGYLMYECTVTSAVPGTETASAYRSKPGYFGRPWQANTAETVFYKTTIETSDNPGYAGQSLIEEAGWNNTLSGSSALCCEYGTIEQSGADNSGSRASWATVLAEPKLADGTEITTLNFTKGTDGWDPFPALIANDPAASICTPDVNGGQWTVFADGNLLHVQGIEGSTRIAVYGTDGQLVQNLETGSNVSLPLQEGIWIVRISDSQGTRTMKVAAR